MAEKLRRKFILISVSAVLIVILVIAGWINLSNYMQIDERTNDLLLLLTENDGYFPKEKDNKNKAELPPKFSAEAPFSTRFFTVQTDSKGTITSVDTGKISSTSTAQALTYARQVLASNKESGYLNNYKYLIAQKDAGYLLVFVDCSHDLQLFYSSLKTSIIISLIGLCAVFLLVFIFSKKAVAPLVESYEKQKQFITNVSHELKTPLAIIKTNTEVLELDACENQWTQSIHHQVKRLSTLVGSLVALTHMDEEENTLPKTIFPLSTAITETAQPFLALAQDTKKELLLDIEDSLSYRGNELAICQLVSILLENSLKYGDSNFPITLSLHSQGKKLILESTNAGFGFTAGNYDCLFERFYRTDHSRNSQTGGHGIGLSIAKAIVVKHKGKISAKSPDGKWIVFTVQL